MGHFKNQKVQDGQYLKLKRKDPTKQFYNIVSDIKEKNLLG